MIINKLLSRNQQASSIRDEVIKNPTTRKTACDSYDLYHLTSQKADTRGLLLQVAVYHDGRFYLVLEGAFPMGLSNNNYIDFDEHYSDFIALFCKAF